MKLSAGGPHSQSRGLDAPSAKTSFYKSGKARPLHLINHFEGHKELTRKDELFTNLRTQLQHDNENIFDYMPVTFHVTLPEGKQPPLEHFLKKFMTVYGILDEYKQFIRT